MSNPFKIEWKARQHPACFTAFDILFYQDKETMKLPLMERKELLEKAVQSESPRFAISRTIEKQGKAFYELAKQQELEGHRSQAIGQPILSWKKDERLD